MCALKTKYGLKNIFALLKYINALVIKLQTVIARFHFKYHKKLASNAGVEAYVHSPLSKELSGEKDKTKPKIKTNQPKNYTSLFRGPLTPPCVHCAFLKNLTHVKDKKKYEIKFVV